tara:strand:- start:849 stop:1124 length:276 start_codon:yes stop_codon:yes gene_type:complete
MQGKSHCCYCSYLIIFTCCTRLTDNFFFFHIFFFPSFFTVAVEHHQRVIFLEPVQQLPMKILARLVNGVIRQDQLLKLVANPVLLVSGPIL